MIFNFSFLSLSLSLFLLSLQFMLSGQGDLKGREVGGKAAPSLERHVTYFSLPLSLSLSGVYDYYHHFSRLFCLWFDSLISALLICKRVYRTINGGGLQVTMGAFGESIGHVGFIGVAPLIPRRWFFIIISPSSSSSPSPSSSSFYTTVLIVCHLLTFDLSLPFLLFFFWKTSSSSSSRRRQRQTDTHTDTQKDVWERAREKKQTNKQKK